MKIKHIYRNLCTLREIKVGDCFEHNSKFYIKTNGIGIGGVNPQCVELESGTLHCLDINDEVAKISIEAVINPSER